VSSSIQVSGAPASLSAVRVTLDATHAFAYDLEATLVSPAGTRIPLFACIYAANYPRGYPWTVFDANAVSSANGASSVEQELKPIGALESLAGEDGNGTWRQELVDRINPGYAGQLLDWGVSLR
jgi:subtilisin-like proprotein convertase family protein